MNRHSHSDTASSKNAVGATHTLSSTLADKNECHTSAGQKVPQFLLQVTTQRCPVPPGQVKNEVKSRSLLQGHYRVKVPSSSCSHTNRSGQRCPVPPAGHTNEVKGAQFLLQVNNDNPSSSLILTRSKVPVPPAGHTEVKGPSYYEVKSSSSPARVLPLPPVPGAFSSLALLPPGPPTPCLSYPLASYPLGPLPPGPPTPGSPTPGPSPLGLLPPPTPWPSYPLAPPTPWASYPLATHPMALHPGHLAYHLLASPSLAPGFLSTTLH
nr:formin-2-like [Penaeus vannamei]